MAEQGGNTQINLGKLREILLERAVSDDLRIFCFDLGVKYEVVVSPSDKLPIAIVNVIQHFDVLGQLPQLVERAKKEYDAEDWPLIYETPSTPVNIYTGIGTAVALPATSSGGFSFTPPRQPGPLRVFLCHAKEDKPAVRELYAKLTNAGMKPWLDREELIGGQKWRSEIEQEIQATDVFLVCLSHNSIKSNGYIRHEIELALDIAERQSEGAIYFIPVRLEECEYPERVGDYQGIDLFDVRGHEQLMRALSTRARTLGSVSLPLPDVAIKPSQGSLTQQTLDRPVWIKSKLLNLDSPRSEEVERVSRENLAQASIKSFLIELPELNFRLELVEVSAGPFLMGSDKAKDKQASDAELPQHTLTLDVFQIGKYPVTNAQYTIYAKASGKPFIPPEGKENHPIAGVTWHDAMSFCLWLQEASGRMVALPSEAEWEKAARGPSTGSEVGRIWPWGNTFDKAKANTDAGRRGIGDTTPVGSYSALGGDSPYGCADMVGNVREWTRSLWGKNSNKPEFGYPYSHRLSERENVAASGDTMRVMRGGSYNDDVELIRCARRDFSNPTFHYNDFGFRIVVRPRSFMTSVL